MGILLGITNKKKKSKLAALRVIAVFFSCAKCPDYDDRVTKIPIFKRHALTMQQQDYLHRYMSKQAIESVIGMLDKPSSIRELASGSKGQSETESWKSPY